MATANTSSTAIATEALDAVFTALEGADIAQALRRSRWGYAAVNGVHILGIALLIGAIVPLNLRSLGLWRGVPRPLLARILVPMAAAGLFLAIAAGLLLFSVRAGDYAGLALFQVKLALIAIGTVAALGYHLRHGWPDGDADALVLRCHAVLSLASWLGALVCGRLLGFVGD